MEDQRQLTLLWDRFLGTQPVLMLNYNFFITESLCIINTSTWAITTSSFPGFCLCIGL